MAGSTVTPLKSKKSFRDLLKRSPKLVVPPPQSIPSPLRNRSPLVASTPVQLPQPPKATMKEAGGEKGEEIKLDERMQDVTRSMALLESTLASLETLGIVPSTPTPPLVDWNRNQPIRQNENDATSNRSSPLEKEAIKYDYNIVESYMQHSEAGDESFPLAESSLDLDLGSDFTVDFMDNANRIPFPPSSSALPKTRSTNTLPSSYSKSSVSSSALDRVLDLGQHNNFDAATRSYYADARFHDEFNPHSSADFPAPPVSTLSSLPPGARRQSYNRLASIGNNNYILPNESTRYTTSMLPLMTEEWTGDIPSSIRPEVMQRLSEGGESPSSLKTSSTVDSVFSEIFSTEPDQPNDYASTQPANLEPAHQRPTTPLPALPATPVNRLRKPQPASRSFSAPPASVVLDNADELHITSDPLPSPAPTTQSSAPPSASPSPSSSPVIQRKRSFGLLRRKKSSILSEPVPIIPIGLDALSSPSSPTLSITPSGRKPKLSFFSGKRFRKSDPVPPVPPIPIQRISSSATYPVQPMGLDVPVEVINPAPTFAIELPTPLDPLLLVSVDSLDNTIPSPGSSRSLAYSPIESPAALSYHSSVPSEGYFVESARPASHMEARLNAILVVDEGVVVDSESNFADEAAIKRERTRLVRGSSCITFDPISDDVSSSPEDDTMRRLWTNDLERSDDVVQGEEGNVAVKDNDEEGTEEEENEEMGSQEDADDVPLGEIPGALGMQRNLVQELASKPPKKRSSRPARPSAPVAAPVRQAPSIPFPNVALPMTKSVGHSMLPQNDHSVGRRSGPTSQPLNESIAGSVLTIDSTVPRSRIHSAESSSSLRSAYGLSSTSHGDSPVRRTNMSARVPPPRLPLTLDVANQKYHSDQNHSANSLTSPDSQLRSATSSVVSDGRSTHHRPSVTSRASPIPRTAPPGMRLPLPPAQASNHPTLQQQPQKIFIRSQAQAIMVMCDTLTRCGDVVGEMGGKGLLDGGDESKEGGFILWEIWSDMGVQRPIREFELLSDVLKSWSYDSNILMIRQTLLAPMLSFNVRLIPPPLHSGWLQHRSKRGKWGKRFVELKDGVLSYSKTEKMKDPQVICNLLSFDGFYVTSEATATLKAPRPFAFALKSTLPQVHYEDSAEYCHYLATKTESDRDDWMQAIIEARNMNLRQRGRDMRSAHSANPTGIAARLNNGSTLLVKADSTTATATPSSANSYATQIAITSAAIAALSTASTEKSSNGRARSKSFGSTSQKHQPIPLLYRPPVPTLAMGNGGRSS